MTPELGPVSLERMVRAVERVRERMLRATAALDAAGVPYAVVGGHAVAAWVERTDQGGVRNTPDVEILIRRPHLDAASTALGEAGFHRRQIEGAYVFLDGPECRVREAVHLIFAGERVKADDAERTPDVAESERHGAFRVVSLPGLVRLKLTSFRLKDRVHLRDLIDVGLIDAGWVATLPPELGRRLQELLDNPEG